MVVTFFQLSDVLQGGYTVFPELNVFLKPIKGALVMWHNLYRNLRHDNRTLHAGCPVLEGSKRSKHKPSSINLSIYTDYIDITSFKVGNVWIHTADQEFLRPCSLNQDE